MEQKRNQNETPETTEASEGFSDAVKEILRSFAAKIDKNPQVRAALLEAVRIGEEREKKAAASNMRCRTATPRPLFCKSRNKWKALQAEGQRHATQWAAIDNNRGTLELADLGRIAELRRGRRCAAVLYHCADPRAQKKGGTRRFRPKKHGKTELT